MRTGVPTYPHPPTGFRRRNPPGLGRKISEGLGDPKSNVRLEWSGSTAARDWIKLTDDDDPMPAVFGPGFPRRAWAWAEVPESQQDEWTLFFIDAEVGEVRAKLLTESSRCVVNVYDDLKVY